MDNEIKTDTGRVVGSWDGADVGDLMVALKSVRQQLKNNGISEKVTREGVPHQDQLPPDLRNFTPYIIWGCDRTGMCLVGSGANRTETIESIREFYANEIAKDALARRG